MPSILRILPVFFILAFVSLSQVLAGSQLPAFQSEPEYDLIIFDEESGSRQFYKIGERVRITYHLFEDTPSGGHPVKVEGTLEEVNEHSILVDGNWIAISAVTHITNPSEREQPRSEADTLKLVLKILLFPFLAFVSFVFFFAFNYGNDASSENSLRDALSVVSLVGWIGFSILSLQTIIKAFSTKKRVGRNRKLLAFKRG